MATGIQTSVQRGRRSGLVAKSAEPTLWTKIDSYWSKLGKLTKYIIYASLAAALLASLFAGYSVKTSQYVELYPLKLSQEDVSDISMALTDNGIEHSISPTMDGILMSREELFVARAKMAALSLPYRAPVEDNKKPLVDTSEAQRLAEKRRLQTELVHTLRQIEGINDARVQLAIPKKTYFVDEQDPVKASVFLKLRTEGKLDGTTAKGISSLIAHSVADLREENVTLLDHQGRLLAIREVEGRFEFELQTQQETLLEEKLQKALARIYGDRVHAVVNLTLDFSKEEQKRYTPGSAADDGVVKDSIQLVHELLQGPSKEEGKNYDQKKEAINYKYAEYYFAKLRERAKIERITATVLVDGAGKDELEDIRGIVKGAIGIDDTRADEVHLSGAPWNHEPLKLWEDELTPVEVQSSASDANIPLSYGSVALAILCTVGVCTGLLRRSKPVFPVELGGGRTEPATGIVDPNLAKSGTPQNTTLHTAPQPNRVKTLETLVGSRPERVADMLRSTWLS